MERNDLIKLASEAGFGRLLTGDGLPTMWHGADLKSLEHFANLVTAAEREAIVALAAEQGWAMKNEDPFEDAVREICDMQKRSNAKSQATDAALSRQVACTDGLGLGDPERTEA